MTAAIAMFAFGVATAVLSLELPLGTLRAPGSGFFPLLLGVLLAALAAAQGVKVYRERLQQTQPATVVPMQWSGEGTRRAMAFLGAVAGAVALLPLLGYALACFVVMLALLRLLGVANWRLVVAISAATALACYFLFVRALGIPLPTGMLGF